MEIVHTGMVGSKEICSQKKQYSNRDPKPIISKKLKGVQNNTCQTQRKIRRQWPNPIENKFKPIINKYDFAY